jgi:hypothetical protein
MKEKGCNRKLNIDSFKNKKNLDIGLFSEAWTDYQEMRKLFREISPNNERNAIKRDFNQAWLPVMSALRRLRQEDLKFEFSLGYMVRPVIPGTQEVEIRRITVPGQPKGKI